MKRPLQDRLRLATVAPQRWIDSLATTTAEHASRAIAPDVDAIREAIAGATSHEDARARVLAAYRRMRPPRALAAVARNAFVLARMAGHAAQVETAEVLDAATKGKTP